MSLSTRDESLLAGGDVANEYLKTIGRMEPNISMVDAAAYYASAAISLKRIADSLNYIITKIKVEEAKK